MFNSIKLRNMTLAMVVAGLIAPTALAKPQQPMKQHKPAKKVVVIKPTYRPSHKVPAHRYYHQHKVPKRASYIVLAGITYAVIDNMYYKRDSDTYIYVDQPPVTVTKEITTTKTIEVTSRKVGMIVEALPLNTIPVSIKGATFYVKQSDWYAPIAGTDKFVVVEPQL